MDALQRTVSPGINNFVSEELQTILWDIHRENPLSPSIFDLRHGRGRHTQNIYHLCLLPYYHKRHIMQMSQPALDNIRITVLRTGKGWLMRLSNRLLEAQYGERSGPEQETLF